MQKKISHIIFIIFLFCISALHAQEVKVSASVDSSNYLIGDYIRYDLHIQSPVTNTFNWPLIDSIGGELETISVSGVDTLLQNGAYALHQQIVFAAYDSGMFTIHPVYVEYKKQGDTTQYIAVSDSIQLLIQTIPVDTTLAIKPIKENISVTVPDYTLYFIIGGILLLALIVYLIYRYIKKRKLTPKSEKPTLITLYNYTMQKLQELENKKLWQQDAYKNYYSELTDILREYLDIRFDLQTMESTTDEIMEQAVQAGISAELLNQLKFILTTGDLAKFAKSQPLANENTLSLQYAYQLVETTKMQNEKVIEQTK
ncbi:MAG: hypothetical protein IPH61_04030 [Bacteroidetes bacterium]|nr:hypothetical protein [Bacteroidota bacterium]